MRFVIQEHFARTHHFDFRLEHEGVYRSWVIPKGLPIQCGQQRLAIQVSDHELAFGEFEGVIAEGEYGAGEIKIWDRGCYSAEEWSDDRIVVRLSGARIIGTYALARFRAKKKRAWLIRCCNDCGARSNSP